MRLKDYVVLISINIIITGAIILFTRAQNDQSTQPLPEANIQQAEAPQTDSMDDHHKPKPADSAVFNNLTGKEAPDFTLEDYTGKKVSLSGLKGKTVVLFFNEGLMCYPACWNQIAAFGKDKRFSTKDIVTYSIVADPRQDWKQAIDKMPELKGIPVLFDPFRVASNLYGVLTLDSSMHRGQYPGHTYFIISKDGIIRFAKDDSEMAVRNDELSAELTKL